MNALYVGQWPFYLPSSAGAEHGLPMPYAGSGRPADSRPPSDVESEGER